MKSMVPFSYTLSDTLRTALQRTDNLRAQLLIQPIPPKAELKLRWETMLDRIYYSLLIDNVQVRKKEILSTVITSPLVGRQKKLTPQELEIHKYKQGLDYISQEWLVNSKPATFETAIKLYTISCSGKYKKNDTELKELLIYMETNPDHPVIQAAVAYACLQRTHAFTEGNGRIASLISLLFLYRAGYDCRGLLCIEKEWFNQFSDFQERLHNGMHTAYMTTWIEYVADCLANHLEKKLQDAKSVQQSADTTKGFFDLNLRQKGILSMVEEPGLQITNREVQKRFKISQITASRDLAHLVTLGLIIPHGKGRSVYYTKLPVNKI